MIAYVFGGAASGKSAEAERVFATMPPPRVYIATMQPYDDESRARVARHRAQRESLGARTVERYDAALADAVPAGASILLDCMGNLVANALWGEQGAEPPDDAVRPLPDAPAGPVPALRAVCDAVDALAHRAGNLVIVGNDVFRDGPAPTPQIATYLEVLSGAQAHVAAFSDLAVEVVCGVPIPLKGDLPYARP